MLTYKYSMDLLKAGETVLVDRNDDIQVGKIEPTPYANHLIYPRNDRIIVRFYYCSTGSYTFMIPRENIHILYPSKY